MSFVRQQVDKLRRQPLQVRQKFVLASAVLATGLFVGAYYLTTTARAPASGDLSENVESASPFAIIGATWGNMVDYAESVAGRVFPARIIDPPSVTTTDSDTDSEFDLEVYQMMINRAE